MLIERKGVNFISVTLVIQAALWVIDVLKRDLKIFKHFNKTNLLLTIEIYTHCFYNGIFSAVIV